MNKVVAKNRKYCAEISLALNEPMPGTAAPTDVWLLLEYNASWAGKANVANTLDRDFLEWWLRVPAMFEEMGLRTRQQFIRQPDVATKGVRFIISMVAPYGNETFQFQFTDYSEFMQFDWVALVDAPEKFGEARIFEPNYFVCTNGKRDICCARLGLKTYLQLRKFASKRVWQITHLGGHRFAPNVLVLPNPVMYGRVFADDVTKFVMHVESGKLDIDKARGRPLYEPAAQAAEVYLLEQGFNGGELVGLRQNQGDDKDVFECLFLENEDTICVKLRRTSSALEIIASCGSSATKLHYPFEMLSVERQ